MMLLAAICVVSLTTARAAHALPANSGNLTSSALDDLYAGRYRIEKCRHRTAGVADVPDGAIAALGPAIEDVRLGAGSTHGFKALFKYDGAKQYVEDMLRKVATLEPKKMLMPNPMKAGAPRFACVQENSRSSYPWLKIDPWVLCNISPSAAFVVTTVSYIWICPSFFVNPTKFADLTGTGCPTVSNNRWISYHSFTEYQTYIMIHEMMHFYLQMHSLTGTTFPPEQYSLDGCTNLSPLHSLHNPSNYQTYVAMVQQKCTEEPDKPPYNRRYSEIALLPPSNVSYLQTHNLSDIFDVWDPALKPISIDSESVATA